MPPLHLLSYQLQVVQGHYILKYNIAVKRKELAQSMFDNITKQGPPSFLYHFQGRIIFNIEKLHFSYPPLIKTIYSQSLLTLIEDYSKINVGNSKINI